MNSLTIERSLSNFEIAKQNETGFDAPVDLVYTWVDDRDAGWLAAREKWFKLLNHGQILRKRFSSNGELKFSLRSVAKFAPWIRKIFIVTAGQQPEWLNHSHERIQIVSHREMYPDLNDLPTFNSLSIETHLDKVPGLSEHYIYMNDDFFFGREVRKSDFFTEEGKIIVSINMNCFPEPICEKNKRWESLWAVENSDRLLDRAFCKERRPQISHHAYAQTKSIHQSLRSRYSSELKVSSAQKFRSELNIMLQWHLLPYFALYRGDAVYRPCDLTRESRYCDLCSKLQIIESDLRKIEEVHPKFFCLNNGSPNCPEGLALGLDLLAKYFPDRCEFEKP